MLLILTNSADVTADYLADRLRQAGQSYVRLDTDLLVESLIFEFSAYSPRICFDGCQLTPEDIHAVWYRRPEPLKSKNLSRTAEGRWALDEWAEALEAFLSFIPKERWFNHPVYESLASRKLEQLCIARSVGLSVPDTLVTQSEATLTSFFRSHPEGIIIKPLSRGYVEREGGDDSVIYTSRVTIRDLVDLHDLESCPTFFQAEIQKQFDVRVTFVDGDWHGVKLTSSDELGRQVCDIRINNMEDVSYEPVLLPENVQDGLKRLVSHYKLRFAAIDLAASLTGDWVFFEINPGGQWAWQDLAGGMDIYKSFLRAFA